jgi:hypothetical protein
MPRVAGPRSRSRTSSASWSTSAGDCTSRRKSSCGATDGRRPKLPLA